MNIVVTGATGRVGTNLIKRLCDNGHDVTGCLLPNDPLEPKLDGFKLKKVYLNILDAQGMIEVIKEADVVIHTAAIHEGSLLSVPENDFFDINVKGMFNVLEGIKQSDQCTQLICLSSTSVYDVFTAPRSPIKEDQDRKPITLYGLNKILVEDQVRQYAWQYDIPATIIRPNYIMAGPEILNAFNYTVVFDVLFRYAEDEKVQFHTPDNPTAWVEAKKKVNSEVKLDTLCIPRCPDSKTWQWHMTDVRDVIDFIELCLQNDKAFGNTFNLAAPDVCDWTEIVPYIAQKTGRDVIEIEMSNLWQYSFDQSASKEILDFTPRYDHCAMVDVAVAMSKKKDVGIIPRNPPGLI
jgi:nucleoside-diphosphate-sugar epimerase